MSGKTDKPRPFSVTPEQFAANWPKDWNARERERLRSHEDACAAHRGAECSCGFDLDPSAQPDEGAL